MWFMRYQIISKQNDVVINKQLLQLQLFVQELIDLHYRSCQKIREPAENS
jgi:hypothetical protein